MSLKSLFAEIFGPAWNDAETVVAEVGHVAATLVHQAEKELAMIPQPIQDLINRISTLLAAHSNQGATDAQTISDLLAENAAKDAQIAQLTSDGQAKDDQIATLMQELADTQAALQAIADQVPAPADGSGSGDLQP